MLFSIRLQTKKNIESKTETETSNADCCLGVGGGVVVTTIHLLWCLSIVFEAMNKKQFIITCKMKSKRASFPHSEWWIPTQGPDFRSFSLPQWACSSFWYWTQVSGTEFWSLSILARCWISGSHHTTGLGVPLYRYGKISLRKVLSTAGRLLFSPSTLSRWKANTSNQSSVRLIREQYPCLQSSLWVSSRCLPGSCWAKYLFSDGCSDTEKQFYVIHKTLIYFTPGAVSCSH